MNRGLTHSETLLPLVQRGLLSAGLSLGDLSALALTVGPGSFTGLRIGLALAKGLALPNQLPLIAVSTLEAMARSAPGTGPVLAAINARREQVYWAAFHGSEPFVRLVEDTLSPASEATSFLQKQKDAFFVVGDGACLCYNTVCATLGSEPSPFIARGVAKAAQHVFAQGLCCSAASVFPNYLRLPQAERERAARLSQNAESGQ